MTKFCFFFLQHLAQEVIDIYHQLRRLCYELRRRRDNVSVDSGIASTTSEEIQANQVRVGMFSNLLQDFKSLIEDLLAQGPEMVLIYYIFFRYIINLHKGKTVKTKLPINTLCNKHQNSNIYANK